MTTRSKAQNKAMFAMKREQSVIPRGQEWHVFDDQGELVETYDEDYGYDARACARNIGGHAELHAMIGD